jgi:hypothetical protein
MGSSWLAINQSIDRSTCLNSTSNQQTHPQWDAEEEPLQLALLRIERCQRLLSLLLAQQTHS